MGMSCWPGKGRNLRQKWGGKKQGQWHGHCAAQTTHATTEAHTTPAPTTKEHTPPAEVRTTPSETMKVRAMPTCTMRRDGVHGARAHGSVGRQVVDDHMSTTCGGVEQLGLTHMETQRGVWWTTRMRKGVGSKDRNTTPPQPVPPQCASYWAPPAWIGHQQEHKLQRPTERSDSTQHAKGRRGDCPGRKETATRRNVT